MHTDAVSGVSEAADADAGDPRQAGRSGAMSTGQMRQMERMDASVLDTELAGKSGGSLAKDVSARGEDACLAESETSALHAQAGWAQLLDWRGIPRLHGTPSHWRTRLFTSYDRGTLKPGLFEDLGNKDYNSFLAVCGDRPKLFEQEVDDSVPCEPGQTGYLIAADDGPGFVSRITLALGVIDPVAPFSPVREEPTEERIRIYVDDAAQPVYEGAWRDWWDHGDPPFQAPLMIRTSGNLLSYVPISYAKKVRIFLDKLSPVEQTFYYYHVTTHSADETQPFNPKALGSDCAHAQLESMMQAARGEGAEQWLDAAVTLDGETSTTAWERSEPGTIRRLHVRIDGEDAAQALADVSLRVFWDDETAPAIDLPLATLFGMRQELSSFTTWAMTSETSPSATDLSFTLPMPFAARARIELAQRETRKHTVHLQIQGVPNVPGDTWGKLYTTFHVATNPRAGDRFLVAELEGPGKYVGTLMFMSGRGDNELFPFAQPANFLEGDEMLEVDGVTGSGTGTEESFGGGWYFSTGPFSAPLSAALHIRNARDNPVGEATALRWTILHDEVQFREKFRLSYEYGANKPATAIEYAAVGFYYK